jgi:hypothetical protein
MLPPIRERGTESDREPLLACAVAGSAGAALGLFLVVLVVSPD